jgi:hypothetical protein
MDRFMWDIRLIKTSHMNKIIPEMYFESKRWPIPGKMADQNAMMTGSLKCICVVPRILTKALARRADVLCCCDCAMEFYPPENIYSCIMAIIWEIIPK